MGNARRSGAERLWWSVLAVLSVTVATAPLCASEALPVRMSIAGACFDPAVTQERPVLTTGRFATLEDCLKAGRKGAAAKGATKDAAPMSSKPVAPAPPPRPAPTAASPQPVPDRALFDTDDPALVKRSRTDLCLERGSVGYADAVHFRAYRTMQDCVDSGGHR